MRLQCYRAVLAATSHLFISWSLVALRPQAWHRHVCAFEANPPKYEHVDNATVFVLPYCCGDVNLRRVGS